jgi:hypothetical protein
LVADAATKAAAFMMSGFGHDFIKSSFDESRFARTDDFVIIRARPARPFVRLAFRLPVRKRHNVGPCLGLPETRVTAPNRVRRGAGQLALPIAAETFVRSDQV